MAWLLQSLAKTNIEEFIVAAEGSGLLLNGKTMNVESAAVVWEEAEEGSCNLGQQQIILRHLVFYFGQRFTVPEQKLCELQEGTLLPITDSVEIEGEIIHFWYKTLQEVVLPCQA